MLETSKKYLSVYRFRYNSNVDSPKGDNIPLNGDHTHFLMIDDGTRYG